MSLPPELSKWRDIIKRHAEDCNLDFFDVIFEMVDWKQINEIAAYGGFPSRYPHWRFGMEYERLSKSYAYGLSKIYEMVINNDPCYAYLLHANNLVDQKLVMAHVYGHCDFFKNNKYFEHTDRKMIDKMGNHKTQIEMLINRYGLEKIEGFMDACLSIENLIDYNAPGIKRPVSKRPVGFTEEEAIKVVKKLRSKQYMDKFINPIDFLEEQKKTIEEELAKEKRFPEHPQRDVLNFLLEYAPLESWQRKMLAIVKEEAYYFAPQGQTKVMNEGWSVYWHSKIMTRKILDASEIIDYADHHSGTLAMAPGSLNPYKLGVELFRDIEDRWNKGKFGKEYDDCDDMVAKKKWDRKLGKGIDKIFEVRKLYNDINFIDTFLTPEFCAKEKLFIFAYNIKSDQYEIASREFNKIKQQLLFQLTNFGNPIIEVVDGNYGNKSELMLKHVHEGIDLKFDYAQEVLKNLNKIWQRPVNIATVVEGTPKILSFDGEKHKEFHP
ncbi:SpoVR family protein [bacterium]|nr:SpoVR family protein [bacterium]